MKYGIAFRRAAREIIDKLLSEQAMSIGKDELNSIKHSISRKYCIGDIPTNVDIAHFASREERDTLKRVLSNKPVRSLSGVSVIAVMSKPHNCPHGRCIYCAGGIGSEFGDVPQSYTGREPATRRAIRNNYNPYLQVMNRLEQYVAINSIPDKAEVIIMGGTFPSLPRSYQEGFVRDIFKALNDFSLTFFDKKGKLLLSKFQDFFELPASLDDEERIRRINARLLSLRNRRSTSLEREQSRNEKTKIKCKCVGLTVETRPDYGLLLQGNFMLRLGCTKVELGIQTTRGDILSKIERGYDESAALRSIQELKDLGFKLNFHIMPGLPFMKRKEIIDDFKRLFSDERYTPDMLKIYPCMVMRGTKLYAMWKRGEFKPLSTASARDLIIRQKQFVPAYCRIMRVQRDIPTYATEAGVGMTNLRQKISAKMEKLGIECKCIRCNEIGRRKLAKVPSIHISEYASSGGIEFFISYGDGNVIAGFARLRFPGQYLRAEICEDSALLRELHVYGSAVEIGKKGRALGQHIGIGRQLIAEAEGICRTYYKKKLLVISAVGVRGYFRKLGYRREGPYMAKKIA